MQITSEQPAMIGSDGADAGCGGVRYVFSREVFQRNCMIAGVVGLLLTITNQLDVLFAQPFSFRLGTKIFFNFLIPFAVSSTSALINRK